MVYDNVASHIAPTRSTGGPEAAETVGLSGNWLPDRSCRAAGNSARQIARAFVNRLLADEPTGTSTETKIIMDLLDRTGTTVRWPRTTVDLMRQRWLSCPSRAAGTRRCLRMTASARFPAK